MRICDIRGCGEPAKEVVVEMHSMTPTGDGSSSVDTMRYGMDLCDTHQQSLASAIAAYEPLEEVDA